MFRKCLKYDLVPVAKVWWIAAVTVLVLAFPVGLCCRDWMIHIEDPDYFPWSYFCIMLGWLSLWVFMLLTFILTAVRFYSNFFRDEGYLTFTLPVRRQTLFLSKVANGMIWMVASALVSAAAVCIALSMTPSEPDSKISALAAVLKGIGEIYADGYKEVGWWVAVYTGELLLAALLSTLSSILFVYLCITIGGVLAKKHKLLASIGTYYVFNIITTVAVYVGAIFLVLWIISAYDAFPDAALGNGGAALILLLGCVVIALIDSLLALVNLGCLERKLNLA